MDLARQLEYFPGFVVPEAIDRFRAHIDPVWVEEALAATGTATVRRRRLPAEQVLWLVVGMALLRNESIERVAMMLNLALPTRQGDTVAKSALSQARRRLGEDPLAYLFAVTADAWASASADRYRWRGLALYGADGTTLRVPDTEENWEAFGGQSSNGTRAGSAYPTVRLLAVMALRSHLMSAVRFGDYKTGELTLANEVWNELPDDSMLIGDRNFLVAHMLHSVTTSGRNRHWMTRAKSRTRLRTIKKFARNDRLVEIELSDETRRRYPQLPALWEARAITYKRRGFDAVTLLTSLVDPANFPESELVALYHERWEIELGYDEIKTHMLERQEAIRSRTPDGVRQELWGIMLAYNLVRVEMERAADEAGVEPTRISFVNALAMIRHAWIAWSTQPLAPARIPAALLDLRRQLKLLLLPERRPKRRAPREVKLKMSNYDKKWSKRDKDLK